MDSGIPGCWPRPRCMHRTQHHCHGHPRLPTNHCLQLSCRRRCFRGHVAWLVVPILMRAMESGPTKKPRAASSRRRLGPSTPRTPREAHRRHPDAVPTLAPLSVCPKWCCFCTRRCVMDSAIPGVHAPRQHRPVLRSWGTWVSEIAHALVPTVRAPRERRGTTL